MPGAGVFRGDGVAARPCRASVAGVYPPVAISRTAATSSAFFAVRLSPSGHAAAESRISLSLATVSFSGSAARVPGDSAAQCDTNGTWSLAPLILTAALAPLLVSDLTSGWHTSQQYTVLAAMSQVFTAEPHRPHERWLYTYRRVHGSPRVLASSGSTVRMLPVTKPRCRSSTECLQTSSKEERGRSAHGCSGWTPAL